MATLLTVVPCPKDPAVIATYTNRYQGVSTHKFLCGKCFYDVAVGVDPHLYPAMFKSATHRFKRCAIHRRLLMTSHHHRANPARIACEHFWWLVAFRLSRLLAHS